MNSPLMGHLVVETLAKCGVQEVVLAPGSRSSALAIALHAADQAGRLRLHVRVDERVAAFTALGLAKGSARVTAVVTTSGTAVGNLVPAAMEARAAGVGLLLISADRPSELVGTGANQTTNQVGALGNSVLEVVRLSSRSGAPEAWAAQVQRGHTLAAGSRTRTPGPVQLNIEFTPPLVGPTEAPDVPVAQIHSSAPCPEVAELGAARTVVVAGDAPFEVGAEARALAELARVPLLAEPSSNARTGRNAIAGYRHLVATELGNRIQRVVLFGHATLSRPMTALLSRPDVELVVVAERANWPDVGHRAHLVADRVSLPESDGTWLADWQAADAALTREVTWGGQAVADLTLAALGDGDNLVAGASMAIRYLDLCPIQQQPPRLFANRGLSGIDGTIASATGIALATGRPTTVLLGDLSLQHDLGALVLPPQEPRSPLRIVVADDNGGGIFTNLEVSNEPYLEAFERVFATPQGLDLVALGNALGWSARRVDSRVALQQELAVPVRGRSLIVASLPPVATFQ